MNYFSPKSAAERYKAGRPQYHELTIEKIKSFLQIEKPLNCCLDIACGTGFSTTPLAKIAERVIGIDASSQMLAQADAHPRVSYQLGRAEQLPFDKQTVDLMTVSSGIHWFQVNLFLAEAERVLKSKGHLVIYDNFFTGFSGEQAESFMNWYINTYLFKFKSPPRNKVISYQESLKNLSFKVVHKERYSNAVLWKKKRLIKYLSTQSNIISNVELGHYSLEEVYEWLDQELSPYFRKETTREATFGNKIFYLKKD